MIALGGGLITLIFMFYVAGIKESMADITLMQEKLSDLQIISIISLVVNFIFFFFSILK